MSSGAKVNDIEVLYEFRIALIKFAEMAGNALGEAESDVQRTIMWLENDQQSYWSTQIRHRQDDLVRAQEALRQKKIFKDSTGGTPSAIEEQKAVNNAQAKLRDAQDKLAKVKLHAKRLQKEALLYKGQTQRFSAAVFGDIPTMVSHLGALAERLQEYASLDPTAGRSFEESVSNYFGVTQTGSMSRGEGGPLLDGGEAYAGLRAKAPDAAARAAAPAVDTASGRLPVEHVEPEAATRLADLKVPWAAPDPLAKVAVAHRLSAAAKIFLDRAEAASDGDSGWFVGPVDGEAGVQIETLSIADVLAARPDLKQLLSLPPGYLAVLDRGSVAAILNDKDKDVWPATAPPAPAAQPPATP